MVDIGKNVEKGKIMERIEDVEKRENMRVEKD